MSLSKVRIIVLYKEKISMFDIKKKYMLIPILHLVKYNTFKLQCTLYIVHYKMASTRERERLISKFISSEY